MSNDRLEVKVWDEAGDVQFGANEDISAISLQFAKLRLSRDAKCLALLAWTWDRKSRVDPGRYRLRVWDLATGRELFRRDGDEPEMSSVAALSPVGRLLAVSALAGGGEGPERKVRTIDFSLRDLAAGRERLKFELPGVGDGDRIVGLAFSPDGRRLAGSLGGVKGSLRAWDTTTGNAIMARGYTRACHGDPAYSADGRWLAVGIGSRRGPGRIEVVDASSGEVLRSLAGHRSEVQKLIFSPDGRRLASCASRGPGPPRSNCGTSPEERNY